MNSTTLDLNELRRFATLAGVSGKDAESLDYAAQSIAKRVEYSSYHLLEFRRFGTGPNLVLDRIGRATTSDGISFRIAYEANAVAFLQNLHSLVDSVPYVINIVFRKVNDIEHASVAWGREFLSKYSGYGFYPQLNDLFESEELCKLKGLINRIKHKHLVPIRNKYDNLLFVEYTYKFNGHLVAVNNQDVSAFMTESNNALVPKTISVLNALLAEPI
jgi:hypothetical protein